jgi:dolichol-phosphate mannosyltransferase
VVNDHSTDAMADLVKGLSARYPNLKLVDNLGDKGFANALRTGFANANNELLVPVMADLCDDLNTIKEMLHKIEQGYDVVCAARYIKGGARIGGPRL